MVDSLKSHKGYVRRGKDWRFYQVNKEIKLNCHWHYDGCLNHCGLVTQYGNNTHSGNDLLPEATKSLSEPRLLSSVRSVSFGDSHPRAISKKIPQPSITKIILRIIKFPLKFPRRDFGISQDLIIRRLNQDWIGALITIWNGPHLLIWIIFDPAWIISQMATEMHGEITYPHFTS